MTDKMLVPRLLFRLWLLLMLPVTLTGTVLFLLIRPITIGWEAGERWFRMAGLAVVKDDKARRT